MASTTCVLDSTGISAIDAETDESAPNRTYAIDADVLVTTMESPPPVNCMLVDAVPALTDTVPVGRNGVTDPTGMF